MKIHKNPRSGAIRRIVLLSAILAFIAFQCVIIFSVISFFRPSFAVPKPVVVRDATEEVFVRQYLSLIKDAEGTFTESTYRKDIRSFDYPAILAANTGTVENRVIRLLDTGQNETLAVILKDSRVLFGEAYFLGIARNLAGLLREYALKKAAEGETDKALAAVNSMLSISMLTFRGCEGHKFIVTYLVSYAIHINAIRTLEAVLDSPKATAKPERLAALAGAMDYYNKLYPDYFDCLRDEINACAYYVRTYYECDDRRYYSSTATFYATKALILGSEIYYGASIPDHYKKYMSAVFDLRGKPFRELAASLATLSKPYDKINSSTVYIYALLNSEINPLSLGMVPNLEKFYYQWAFAKMKMNAEQVKIELRRKALEGVRVPGNFESVSSLPALKSRPELFTDYFTDSKLRITESPTGEVVIYSAGIDGKDDGGKFKRAGAPLPAQAYGVAPGSFMDIDCQDIKL